MLNSDGVAVSANSGAYAGYGGNGSKKCEALPRWSSLGRMADTPATVETNASHEARPPRVVGNRAVLSGRNESERPIGVKGREQVLAHLIRALVPLEGRVVVT